MGAATAPWPTGASAQQPKLARIGALYIGTADAESFQQGLRQAMRELGYVEGRNLGFEFRSAEGSLERLPGLAAELVQLNVDVIVALYVPPSLAAKQATDKIPIVVIVGDPIEAGIVPSLASPGGNITGVSLMASPSAGKSVELFRDMLPSARRIGVLGHATNPVYAKSMLAEVRLVGGATGLEIHPVVMVTTPEEFESAFETMTKEQADAAVVQGSLATKPVADAALKFRLPTVSTAPAYVGVGGLMSFGADGPAAFRHSARFVQRILEGKQPKDIPIEQPTKFELAVNLKTAKAIGIEITSSFLLRADTVLE
jgi:putative ABC transport system substrate-binding protein